MEIKILKLTFNNAAVDVRFIPVDYEKYAIPFHWDRGSAVKCTGEDCPYCKDGASIHTRYAIPFYVESERCIKYWMRSNFSMHIIQDLYKKYDRHPEKYTFKIIRHGDMFDKLTTYEFVNLGEARTDITIPELAEPEDFDYLFRPVNSEEETA